MLYREIIAVCSEIHTNHINTLCGQNVELLNVKPAVHIVTTGLKGLIQGESSGILVYWQYWLISAFQMQNLLKMLQLILFIKLWKRKKKERKKEKTRLVMAAQLGTLWRHAFYCMLISGRPWHRTGPHDLHCYHLGERAYRKAVQMWNGISLRKRDPKYSLGM